MSTHARATDEVVWRPSPDLIERANVTRLMREHGIRSADEMRARSLELTWFWEAVARDLEFDFATPYHTLFDASDGPAHTRWFIGGELNLAESCAGRWAKHDPDRRAVAWDTELGERAELSFSELDALSARAAGALHDLDVGPSDTVGIFMPMAPQTVAAILGCWKLGAIAVPVFSGYGADAISQRLQDAGARVLITADAFPRRGSTVQMKQVADAACGEAECVEKILCWRRMGIDVPWDAARDVDWDEAVARATPMQTAALPSDHPALLIYTSGSTGRPKGAVLTHGGLMAQANKDAAYHFDLSPDDSLCWVTDIGWVMGPWTIIAAGIRGAAVCLLEGAPTSPSPNRLWSFVEREQITVLGVSPSLIRGMATAEALPGPSQCASLRILGGTGEPWSPEAYMWLLEQVGEGRCPIINMSGGTEVGGPLLAPLPIDELKPCSAGAGALGMDVAVFDDSGRPQPRGTVGELVCRQPWPGMTQGLWGGDERYLETYWTTFPGTWLHGDWATEDADGHWFLHGRSDDTLNVAGQRIGPAEAEAVLMAHGGIGEAAVIGVPHPVKGQVLWCFVTAASGARPGIDELSDDVAAKLGKPFRPARVLFVDDLPRTRSSKILRRVVRAVALGKDPGDLSSLENPPAIEAVREAVAKVAGGNATDGIKESA